MTHTLFAWVAAHGSLALFGLLVLGIVGVPVPDETLLVIAGVLVDQARLDAVPTYTAAFLGSALGITVSYLLGRSAGVTIIHRYGHRLGIASKEVAEVRAVFQRGGRWVLMLGYFVPGIRHLTALVAGAAGLPFGRFAVFAYSGAARRSGPRSSSRWACRWATGGRRSQPRSKPTRAPSRSSRSS